MCSARFHLRRSRAAPERRAVVRARPVNSEGRHDRSASDARKGQAAERGGAPTPGSPSGPPPWDRSPRPGQGSARRPGPPDGPRRRPRSGAPSDDGMTAVLPVVRAGAPPTRDPIDAVKAALDGTPPPPPPRRRGRGSGDGPSDPPPGGTPNWRQQINWKWVRRGLIVAAAVLILLPLITFGMAYLIVD